MKDVTIDNSWFMPYSPKLLRMFQCHFNVKLCMSNVGSIKYLLNTSVKDKTGSQLK